MANLTPEDSFDDVYQLERTDPVDAGVNGAGISNKQAQALANRTQYLKNRQDAHQTTLDGLGTASTHADTDFATAAQGAKADTAVQPSALTPIQQKLDALDQAIVLKGDWDASTGAFPAGAESGWSYLVSAAGTVDGVDFALGDRLIALIDAASTVTYAANWFKSDGSDKVGSVFGRVGTVLPQDGDYNADQIAETATSKIMTAAERTKLGGLVKGVDWGAAISAATTLTAADNGKTFKVTADVTVTLPDAATNAGFAVELLQDTPAGHSVTFALQGADTIRGNVASVVGDAAIVCDGAQFYVVDAQYVQSVAGLAGAVTAAELKTALVLDQVDNTSDNSKPISTATQTALDAKAATAAIRAAVPASATASGSAGQIAYDAAYIYICTAANTWLRAPIATW